MIFVNEVSDEVKENESSGKYDIKTRKKRIM